MSRRRDALDTGISLFPFLAVLICTIGALTVALMLLSRQARIEAQERAVAELNKRATAPRDVEPEADAQQLYAGTVPDDAATAPDQPPPPREFTPPAVAEAGAAAPAPMFATPGEARDPFAAARPREPDSAEDRSPAQMPAVAVVADDEPEDEAPDVALPDVEAQIAELDAEYERLQARTAEVREAMQQQRLHLSHVEDHIRSLQFELAQVQQAEASLEESNISEDRDRMLKHLEDLRQIMADKKKALEDAREALSRGPAYAVIPFEGKFQTYRPPVYLECTAEGVTLQPHGITLSATDFAPPLGPGNPLAATLRAMSEHLVLQRSPDGRPTGQPYPLLLVRPDGVEAYYAAREALAEWESDFGYELIDESWPLAFPPGDPQVGAIAREALVAARSRHERASRLVADTRIDDDGPIPQRFRAGSSFEGAVPVDSGSSGDVVGRARRPEGRTPDLARPSPASSQEPSPGGGFRPSGGSADEGTAAVSDGFGQSRVGNLRSTPGGGPRSGGGNDAELSSETARGGPGGRGDAETESTEPGGGGGTTIAIRAPSDAPAESLVDRPPNTQAQPPRFGNPPSNELTIRGAEGRRSDGNEDEEAGQGTSAPNMFGGPTGGKTSQPGIGTPSMLQPPDEPRKAPRVADQRGEGWALPVQRPGVIGVEKSVRMRVDRNAIQVLPDGQNREVDADLQNSLDDVLADVQRQTRRWGVAGPNMVWRPTLKVEATPEGRETAEQLQRLLDGSGMKVDIQTESAPPVRPREARTLRLPPIR